jgi:hypothetical protein
MENRNPIMPEMPVAATLRGRFIVTAGTSRAFFGRCGMENRTAGEIMDWRNELDRCAARLEAIEYFILNLHKDTEFLGETECYGFSLIIHDIADRIGSTIS